MASTLEKTVLTLGERLAEDGRRLAGRHRAPPPWLALLAPVVARAAALAASVDRFERREAVPRRTPAPAMLPEEADAAEATLVWPDAGRPAPAPLRDALRPLVGPEVEQARLHTDAAADAFAGAQRADAVTLGADIYFRQGAYDPDTPRGRGLVAHELTHVAAALAPGADWGRATEPALRAEEALARSREHAVARNEVAARSPLATVAVRPPAAPAPAIPPAAMSTAAMGAAASPQARPMRADADRPGPAAATQAAAGAGFDQLRDSLYRDIMARIRVDFERGA